MSAHHDGRTLPWRLLGRAVKPYALAVSFATAVVSWAILAGVAVGQLLDVWPGQIVGVAGWAAVGLLWAGWWGQRDDLMQHGLLTTVFVWASVWGILIWDTGLGSVSAWLALAWAMASGGAWILEALDRERS